MDDSLYEEMSATENTYWWFVAKRRIIQSLIARYSSPTDVAPDDPERAAPRALDIGCGTGAMLSELGTLGFEAWGCDNHSASLEACQRSGLSVRSGTLPDGLPFPPQTFDVVIMSDVLEHVEEDAASVESAASLLKPGGILICTVPAHPALWTRRDELHHHKRRYRRARFRALFPELDLVEHVFSWYNSALFPLMAVSRIISRWTGSDADPDIKSLPAPLNSFLQQIFEAEKWLLGRIPLPPGGSLISLHRLAP